MTVKELRLKLVYLEEVGGNDLIVEMLAQEYKRLTFTDWWQPWSHPMAFYKGGE